MSKINEAPRSKLRGIKAEFLRSQQPHFAKASLGVPPAPSSSEQALRFSAKGNKLKKELRKLAEPERARILQRFFKTGKGEYGKGDKFLGITVPQSRKIAMEFKYLPFAEITNLLQSKIHEERLIALLILVHRFNLGLEKEKQSIFDFYLKNTKFINNWDLVDLSADKIVGGYLFARQPRVSDDAQLKDLNPSSDSASLSKIRLQSEPTPNFSSSESRLPRFNNFLLKLAKSKNLWERRIAVLATFQFIKYNRFEESLKLAEMLLKDEHDLIHKAVGWMLREVGKKNLETEIKFINKHYKKMPRTMLRYAIEKFPEKLRLSLLKK